MITKEQAMNCRNFLQTHYFESTKQYQNGVLISVVDYPARAIPLDKPIKWRANGKCKTWKRDSSRFQLSIKHGLYSCGYLTEENAHLFIVEE